MEYTTQMSTMLATGEEEMMSEAELERLQEKMEDRANGC